MTKTPAHFLIVVIEILLIIPTERIVFLALVTGKIERGVWGFDGRCH
jgi:hypothetical protein